MEKKSEAPERLIPEFYPFEIEHETHLSERVFLDIYKKSADRRPLSQNWQMIEKKEPREWSFPTRNVKRDWYVSIHFPVLTTRKALEKCLPAVFKKIKTVREGLPVRGSFSPLTNRDANAKSSSPPVSQTSNVKTLSFKLKAYSQGRMAFRQTIEERRRKKISETPRRPYKKHPKVDRLLWTQIHRKWKSLADKYPNAESRRNEIYGWHEEERRVGNALPYLTAHSLQWYGQSKKYPHS